MPVVGDELNRRELSEFGHARVRMIVVPQTHSRYSRWRQSAPGSRRRRSAPGIMPVVGDELNRRELSEFGHARVRMIVVPQTHSRYACRTLLRRVGKNSTFHLAFHLLLPLAY